MRFIPEEFTSNERIFNLDSQIFKTIIKCAMDAVPNEVGVNFSNGLIFEMKRFEDSTPRSYRLHTHPNGIAFPSEGDLDVMVERFGAGVDHHILAVRPDKQRAAFRSYNCPFGIERTLINVDGHLCSEVRFDSDSLDYIYKEKENIVEVVADMEKFLSLKMPEHYYKFLYK